MRIDASGNVGIGVTPEAISTYTNVQAQGSSQGGIFTSTTSGGDKARFYVTTTAGYAGTVSNQDFIFLTNDTERMRIDSSGTVNVHDRLLVNGATSNAQLSVLGDASLRAQNVQVAVNGHTAIGFFNASGTEVGGISVAASATAYNTSSDYRLKTDAQPMTGATDRLKQLNPVNFEWIADGTRVDGFLAHEAQAVVPEAISGTKDAMRDEEYEVTPAVLDDDGNITTEAVMGTRSVPDYQGIDQSKLVPLLVATIKELEARITALENA